MGTAGQIAEGLNSEAEKEGSTSTLVAVPFGFGGYGLKAENVKRRRVKSPMPSCFISSLFAFPPAGRRFTLLERDVGTK